MSTFVELPHHHGNSQIVQQMSDMISHTERFQAVADLFKLMDDNTRMRIFWVLCHCEECVVNISALMNMSSPAVSHHLRQLKVSGLIVSRREGKEVYYRAADTQQSRLLHKMIEDLMEITCPN